MTEHDEFSDLEAQAVRWLASRFQSGKFRVTRKELSIELGMEDEDAAKPIFERLVGLDFIRHVPGKTFQTAHGLIGRPLFRDWHKIDHSAVEAARRLDNPDQAERLKRWYRRQIKLVVAATVFAILATLVSLANAVFELIGNFKEVLQ